MAAQHYLSKGLLVIPIDPTHLKFTVEPTTWCAQVSPTAIEEHWLAHPDHAVGELVRPTDLVIRAASTRGSAILQKLAEQHGASPFLTCFGQGGETWHLSQAKDAPVRSYAHSEHLLVLQPGDVVTLFPTRHTKEKDTALEVVSAAFLDGLEEATKSLADESASPIVREGPAADAVAQSTMATPRKTENPLARFSLTGKSHELTKLVQAQILVLGSYAMLGQATAIYAAPNTGKTLVVLHDIGKSIETGALDPSKVYYFNLDDNSAGLMSKLQFAEKHGFHMVAEGHRDFSSGEFLSLIEKLIDTPHPSGMVIILDTMKKVTDLMDKRAVVGFTATIRRFVLKGGTVIALAHTNKKLDPNGRPIFAGTSDVVDDFDCAYTLQALPKDHAAKEVFVELKNFKQRGGVTDQTVYSYTRIDDYHSLLASVREVSADEIIKVQQQAQMARDADVIDSIKAAIDAAAKDGGAKRMDLARVVGQSSGVSRREALGVLDAYTGDDPTRHLWTFAVQARGAKIYSLIGDAQY